MPANYFDEPIASTYDASVAAMFEPAVVDPVVDFLAGLAGDGAALELGIGTGRVALPLSRRGVRVHGIDLSPEMVERLRTKPGADVIGTTRGDCGAPRLDARFRLAYLVFNTIGNVTTQDAQVQCFENVAAHLEPGGCFVVELEVPGLRRLPPGERFQPFDVRDIHVGFDEYDVANQMLVSHHYWVGADRVAHFSMPFRYVWPSELDLMARIAGMTLRERWADWDRSPFTGESTKHISVWTTPS